jgi:hypothetical protein
MWPQNSDLRAAGGVGAGTKDAGTGAGAGDGSGYGEGALKQLASTAAAACTWRFRCTGGGCHAVVAPKRDPGARALSPPLRTDGLSSTAPKYDFMLPAHMSCLRRPACTTSVRSRCMSTPLRHGRTRLSPLAVCTSAMSCSEPHTAFLGVLACPKRAPVLTNPSIAEFRTR